VSPIAYIYSVTTDVDKMKLNEIRLVLQVIVRGHVTSAVKWKSRLQVLHYKHAGDNSFCQVTQQ